MGHAETLAWAKDFRIPLTIARINLVARIHPCSWRRKGLGAHVSISGPVETLIEDYVFKMGVRFDSVTRADVINSAAEIALKACPAPGCGKTMVTLCQKKGDPSEDICPICETKKHLSGTRHELAWDEALLVVRTLDAYQAGYTYFVDAVLRRDRYGKDHVVRFFYILKPMEEEIHDKILKFGDEFLEGFLAPEIIDCDLLTGKKPEPKREFELLPLPATGA